MLVACGPSAVIDMIASAKLEDNPQVKRLMDVEEVQLQDMPRISSGFSAMDRVFSGSFENSLTILTGKSGKMCIRDRVTTPLSEIFIHKLSAFSK